MKGEYKLHIWIYRTFLLPWIFSTFWNIRGKKGVKIPVEGWNVIISTKTTITQLFLSGSNLKQIFLLCFYKVEQIIYVFFI